MADATTQLQELEAKLQEMGLDQAMQDKILRDARKSVSGASQAAFVSAVSKTAAHEKLAKHREAMKGMRLNISITFDGEGELGFSVTDRLTGAVSRSGSNGRSGKKLHVVNGVEYTSAAEACRTLGIDVGRDSAARKLKSWVKANDATYEVTVPDEKEEEAAE